MADDYNQALDAFMGDTPENTQQGVPQKTETSQKLELLAIYTKHREAAQQRLIEARGNAVNDPSTFSNVKDLENIVKNLSKEINAIRRSILRENEDEKEKLRATIVYKWPHFVTEQLQGKTPPRTAGDDISNGFRMASQYINDAIYVEGRGFFRWNVSVWSNVTDKNCIPGMFSTLQKTIQREIEHHVNDGKAAYTDIEAEIIDEELRKSAVNIGNERYDSAAIKKSIEWLGVSSEKLDQNDYLLNCKDAEVLLGTGEVIAHRRGDYCTKASPYEIGITAGGELPPEEVWDTEAACPKWYRFLQETFCENERLIEWVWRWCGYCSTGLTREQKGYFLYGSGDNGKGVFTSTLMRVLGNYADTMPKGLITKDGKADKRRSLAKIEGYRLLVDNETGEFSHLDEPLFKTLTGGDRVEGVEVFSVGHTFVPKCKLLLCTNNLPKINENDGALWRRIRVVPFNNIVKQEKKNLRLFEDLLYEGDAILQWKCIGARKYLNQGLEDIEEVTMATREYREEEDDISRFITENIEEKIGNLELSNDIWLRYQQWARDEGVQIKPKGAFQRGFPKYLGKHRNLLSAFLDTNSPSRCYKHIALVVPKTKLFP